MEERCALCGFGRVQKFSSSVGDSIHCRDCGGIHNRNKGALPVYTADYFKRHYDSIEPQQTARFSANLQQIQPFVGSRRMLDIGCGTGLFLRVAFDMGYRGCVGIDAQVDAMKIAREKVSGTDITIESSVEQVVGNFGVISLMDSIGHIENIRKMLSLLIHERLEPGGVLLVKTPWFPSSYFRYAHVLGGLLSLIGKSSAVSQELFFLPNRYWLFTEKAMGQFLQQYGLKVLKSEIQPEYSAVGSTPGGIRDLIFQCLFRHLPRFLWGKKAIFIIAQKQG